MSRISAKRSAREVRSSGMRMKSAYRQIERVLQRREEQRSCEARLERAQKKSEDAQRHAEYLKERLDLLDGAFRSRQATLQVVSRRLDDGLVLRWETRVGSVETGSLLGMAAGMILMAVGSAALWGSVVSALPLTLFFALLTMAVVSVAEVPTMSALKVEGGSELVEDLLMMLHTGDNASVSGKVRRVLRCQPGTQVSMGTSLVRQWRSGVRGDA